MKTVLIAEDEPMLRDVLRDAIAEEGYNVEMAVDGREALHLVRTLQTDLILMDVMMPNLDGHQAYQLMRVQPSSLDIPVIMMSAAAAPDRLDPSIAAFLSKPFDLDRLLVLVERLIGPPV